MKKLLLIVLFFIAAGCSEDVGPPSQVIELEVGSSSAITSKRIEGQISTKGEVDVYHMNLVEANRSLQVRCTSETLRPDVDLLVNVYEKQPNGNLVMVAGNHAPEDGILPADIKVNVFIDKPKELYVQVRDLMDNDFSDHSYFLSAKFEAVQDSNESFENAVPLVIDGKRERDMIGSVGDVDYFSVEVPADGVYDISVEFEPTPGTGVRLSIDLYNETGTRIDNRETDNVSGCHMVHYLAQGSYKVVVDDYGRDDFDTTSEYTIGIEQKIVTEMKADDTPDSASGIIALSNGSIDYFEDLDIYRIDAPQTSYINVMGLDFESDMPMVYQLNLFRGPADGMFDPETASVEFSHDYRGGIDGNYQAVLKLDSHDDDEAYYLMIKPALGDYVVTNSPYSAGVTMMTVDDPDENGFGNDTDATAMDLTHVPGAGSPHTGKLAYRGDVDWFEVTVPLATRDRVFSVYLDIPETNEVEYAMDIVRENRAGDGEDSSYSFFRRVFNGSMDHRTVDLKTGFVVPAQSLVLGDATYKIKVYDFQNDDGDLAAYTLVWNMEDIPDAPLSVPGEITAYQYHDEKIESDYTRTITMDYKNGSKGSFKVNTSFLDVANDLDSGIDTVTFPWIAGYVDYEGDEDWFGLDLSGPLSDDTEWYYEIAIDLYFPASDVEYTLEFYPDTNHDGQVYYGKCSSSPRNCSGIFTSLGDDELDVFDFIMSRPENDDRETVLWLGSDTSTRDWRGMVYFRLSDFNYMFLDNSTPNPDADNDYGYGNPYFFRIRLDYHTGAEHPPEFD